MSTKKQLKKNKDESKFFKSQVGRELLESFCTEPVPDADVKAGEDLIARIDFDIYEEANHCQILTGIELKDLPVIVNGLATTTMPLMFVLCWNWSLWPHVSAMALIIFVFGYCWRHERISQGFFFFR